MVACAPRRRRDRRALKRGDVHVSKTVTMLCADFAARDPVKDCTAVATTVQFVAREA